MVSIHDSISSWFQKVSLSEIPESQSSINLRHAHHLLLATPLQSNGTRSTHHPRQQSRRNARGEASETVRFCTRARSISNLILVNEDKSLDLVRPLWRLCSSSDKLSRKHGSQTYNNSSRSCVKLVGDSQKHNPKVRYPSLNQFVLGTSGFCGDATGGKLPTKWYVCAEAVVINHWLYAHWTPKLSLIARPIAWFC